MRVLTSIVATIFMASLAVGCASAGQSGGVIAKLDEAHAVLSSSTGAKARGTYSVHFHRIGADAVPFERNNIPVKPGHYTIRVSPDFSSMAANQNTRLTGNRVPDFDELVEEIELDLEAGTRYYVGARYDGPTLFDWTPVVVRTEKLREDGS